ncbi:unnamed protein product [Lathyrus sativus]|nr:unnamed protein product [Lathyrus sativus]
MLVGFTIFADKIFTLVEARYLSLFIDLDDLSGYSCVQLCWLLFIDILEMLPCSVVSSLVVIRLSYSAGFMSIFQHLEKKKRELDTS